MENEFSDTQHETNPMMDDDVQEEQEEQMKQEQEVDEFVKENQNPIVPTDEPADVDDGLCHTVISRGPNKGKECNEVNRKGTCKHKKKKKVLENNSQGAPVIDKKEKMVNDILNAQNQMRKFKHTEEELRGMTEEELKKAIGMLIQEAILPPPPDVKLDGAQDQVMLNMMYQVSILSAGGAEYLTQQYSKDKFDLEGYAKQLSTKEKDIKEYLKPLIAENRDAIAKYCHPIVPLVLLFSFTGIEVASTNAHKKSK